MEELLELYKNYTHYLQDQIMSLLAIAKCHGWINEKGDIGRQMRERIKELEEKLSSSEMKWFDEWYNLFPDGIKNGGKLIKQDKELCQRKMKVFIKKYNYSPAEIIKATTEYLDERANVNYVYTMLSGNFISHREKGSLLAELCRDLKEDNKKKPVEINNFI